ncbi:UDP-glucose 4-epimerase family protein [methane-oxidizing endosymbiont of Gigantopelta aegis]|uniref:UDP-glucose 4-epimerase family protein n=1 Tax=methane-oxidizing endosymbiont of Gigantopelta aegis TaxID=2794938 RepID=UPI0018DDFB51|nr:SDR family oxidoreductase [methane-oxidizing endosymbiont of Gigantopelta aegis]
MNILVAGATGFVGSVLVNYLIKTGQKVISLSRQQTNLLPTEVEQLIGSMESLIDDAQSSRKQLKHQLQNIDVVIHLAARVHMMQEKSENPLHEFRLVNCDASLALAKMAADSGVKRFIYLSSVKVNGEMTELNKPFKPDDFVEPDDPYGLSKYEAEQGLLKLVRETNMEVVIIRPPLVYGPGVKANFAAMMKWVNKGIPLPFGAIHNKRSLVALDNLVSFIIHCIDHPKAANEIFLISDGEDVSTTELLRKVAKALDNPPRLVPVPVSWMRFVAKLLGKEQVANRLFGSLQVDSAKARELLGWKPVITMDEQLRKTAEVFLNKKASVNE